MKRDFTRVNLNIDSELVRNLDIRADELHISRSACVGVILSEYFERQKQLEMLPQVMASMRDLIVESQRVNPSIDGLQVK